MIVRVVNAKKTTLEEADFNAKFPKVIKVGSPYLVVKTAEEMSSVAADDDTIVIEPLETPKIIYNSVNYLLTLGRDYDTCILVTPTESHVVGSPIGKPALSVEYSAGTIELTWDRNFEAPTSIYRSPLYMSTSSMPKDFRLIARVDGRPIPDNEQFYTDTVPLPFGYSYAYYIQNANGTSDIQVVSR